MKKFYRYIKIAAVKKFLTTLALFALGTTTFAAQCVEDEIDIGKMLSPAPISGKFSDDNFYIWCGSVIKGEDGNYHMLYSRWEKKYHHNAWVTKSEIAHATSKTPFGPWTHKDIALPRRGGDFWDGQFSHNPNVHKFGDKYYLYYTGNSGDGKLIDEGRKINFEHRNKQRVGVAVADSPNGPWTRFDKPLIEVGGDSDIDNLISTNPTVAQMNDGKYLMIYKSFVKEGLGYSGVVHFAAIAENPCGPFVKHKKPLFVSTSSKSKFPAEDPYVWNQNGVYYAILKDMDGSFTPHGRSVVLFYSKDGLDWKLAKNPLVSELKIMWENGTTEKVMHLERPQIISENGKPVGLLFAADYDRDHSFNVTFPLKWNASTCEK